ncbi:MAG: caspase family protein [Bacteroidetes bacterium]|nr:MAG: caspase family protein [Bacteroidota bacterium]
MHPNMLWVAVNSGLNLAYPTTKNTKLAYICTKQFYSNRMRSYYLLLFWLSLPASFGCVGSSLPSSLPTTTKRTPPNTDIDTRSQEEINRELLEGRKEKEPQPNKTTENTTKTPSNTTGEVRVREPQNNPTPTNNPNRNENNITQGNSNLNMLVLPYHQEDICHAFDELSQKQREGIDVVSQGFRDMGFQTGSFTSIMRKMKSSGGCDTHNPTRMLNTALRTAQCAYYAVIETDLDHVQTGSYLALNLTIYDSNTHNVITQQTTDSDRKFTDDTRELIKEAFEKMKPALARELNLAGKPNNTTKVEPNNRQGKIRVNLISDVDKGLPRAQYQNPDAIAVVIGNANYEKTKSVDYALNDAYAMKQYLITSFGFKEANIFYLEDARKGDFELMFGVKGNAKGKLFNNVKAGKSDVVIFYAGHGATGLNDKNAYFVPVDCDAQYLEIGGYPTDVFYQNLAQVPAKSFTVWLDACFSGTELVQNVSPIVVKGKGVAGLREGILMASSTDDQYSTWYPEQGHGLFTYFLLKGIQQARADKNGDNRLTFNELYQYMSDKTEGVPYWARKLNNIEQVPLIKGNTIEKVLIEY